MPKIACLTSTALLMAFAAMPFACKKHGAAVNPAATRSYLMGFANSAPRPDINEIIHSLGIWTTHADAAIISTEVPWDALLNGEDPVAYVTDTYVTLTSIFRNANMKLWVYIDPENGLNRQIDSDPLVARHQSIAQPAIQQLYTNFVVAINNILKPDHLGLALETNLIRLAAPDSIYQGVRQAANSAAAIVRKIDSRVPLSVSVQAEVAWGLLGSNATGYVGITKDFTDFPFLQELGISSYPYMSYASPADMPIDYYAKLTAGHSMPVFVSEGGWTSVNLDTYGIKSSPGQQQAYIRRQGQMLAHANAIALFQLTFTDLAVSAWGPNLMTELAPFAFLGMVDSNFIPKPALTIWDSLRLQPVL